MGCVIASGTFLARSVSWSYCSCYWSEERGVERQPGHPSTLLPGPRLSSLYACICFPASQALWPTLPPTPRWLSHSFPLSPNSSTPSLSSVTLPLLASSVRNPRPSDGSARMPECHVCTLPPALWWDRQTRLGPIFPPQGQCFRENSCQCGQFLSFYQMIPTGYRHGVVSSCLKETETKTTKQTKKLFWPHFLKKKKIWFFFFLHLFRRIPWKSCLHYLLEYPFPMYFFQRTIQKQFSQGSCKNSTENSHPPST